MTMTLTQYSCCRINSTVCWTSFSAKHAEEKNEQSSLLALRVPARLVSTLTYLYLCWVSTADTTWYLVERSGNKKNSRVVFIVVLWNLCKKLICVITTNLIILITLMGRSQGSYRGLCHLFLTVYSPFKTTPLQERSVASVHQAVSIFPHFPPALLSFLCDAGDPA